MNPLLALASAALFAAAPAPAAPASGAPLERFGLFVGADDGGPGRTRLRYASSDAEEVARVLHRFGGISEANTAVLVDPPRARLEEQVARIRGSVEAARAAGVRTELIVYYSGHADETGLLLGAERLDYPELRRVLERVPADVRVAILDSCHAGAIIRTKGGRRLPAFLVDTSTAVHGQAFLTASSANEAAQESDRIRGSYFTSSLLTGLRGAADSTRDGRVTLTEAYQFAFHETLAKTEKTSAGPQHPAYDFHLAGTGDLVMTDVRATSAGLAIAPELAGRLFVRDAEGRLVAELQKIAGHPVELGLEPGVYALTLESAAGVWAARVELAEVSRFPLTMAAFAPAQIEVATRRGPGPEASASGERRVLPVNLAFVPGLGLAEFRSEELPVSHFGFNLLGGRLRALRGFELGTLLNLETEEMVGLQISGLANQVGGAVEGLQIASVWNHGASLVGIQISGAANHVSGGVDGFQIGGAGNLVSGEVRGLQLAGGLNVADEVAGLQIAGFNVADKAWMQLGGVNLASSSGLQIAGVNLGGAAVQLGGVNLATWSGFQLGGVNVAEETGVSLGAINIGRRARAPIGLLNFYEEGYHAVSVSGSDLGGLSLGVKLGGEVTYSALSVGVRRDEQGFTSSAALGVHLVSGKWFLDTDVGATNFYDRRFVTTENHAVAASWRIVAGRTLWSSLAVVAGPSLNVVTSWGGQDLDLAMLPQKVVRSGEVTVRIFPGFTLGLQM